MRINDILIENKQVTEAPLGMLSKLGHGVKSAFGSSKSKGVLATGNASNQLKKDYMAMLGSTGQEAESDNLIAFLQKAGYPVDRVKQTLGKAQAEPIEPTMDPENPPAAGAVQPTPATTRPQGGGKVSGQQSQTPNAIRQRDSRRDTTNAKATTGGAGAFNQMAKQLSKPNDAAAKGTTKPTPTPVTTTPGSADPGGAVDNFKQQMANNTELDRQRKQKEIDQGNTTSNKSKALGPKGRETLGRLGKQSQVRSSGKQGTLDLNSRRHTGNSIIEALSDKQIDAAFLMAVQDKAKAGGSSQPSSQSAPADSGDSGGGSSALGTLARSAMGLRSRSSGSSDTTDSSSPLDGIDLAALKAGLTNAVNDRPVDRSAKQEIQKLIKQL
jgi:ribosomal protein L12E/L44/L45/RPP1/RPP2